MKALLLFTGHLKGLCQNTNYMNHYIKMCDEVFQDCEKIIVTYENIYGSTKTTKLNNNAIKKSYSCIQKLKNRFPENKIKVINETFSKNIRDTCYVDRYKQMISTILRGFYEATSRKDIVIRMRPDSGIPNINAIQSKKTWKTLLKIPNNTIVQYGTWKLTRQKIYLNGDNCFAATWETFKNFTTLWHSNFQTHYENQQKNNISYFEYTMNTVSEFYNFKLYPNPDFLL